jgi:hypothetical protein
LFILDRHYELRLTMASQLIVQSRLDLGIHKKSREAER